VRICFLSVGTFAHVGPYIDHFRAAGHDVRFIALSPSPPRGVPTYDVGPGPDFSVEKDKWKYPLGMLRARRLLRDLQPDVLHAHYATSGGLAGLVCGLRPTVVTAHGTDLTLGAESPVWRPLLSAVFRRADLVNVVSEPMRWLAADLGVPDEKLLVLTPGVELERFCLRPRPPLDGRPVRIICTRRLDPECDPLTILHALAILKRRGIDFEMTFAGDGALRRRAERLAGELGLSKAVWFAGAVPHESLPGLLVRHDVYLAASQRDGTSLSLLEAMASGLYPIVSAIQANHSWVEDGVGGSLFEPGDPRELADRVAGFLQHPESWEGAARVNRARVEASGDRRANMDRLERAYRALVEGRPVPTVASESGARRTDAPGTEAPFVTIVVPCRNEAKYVRRVLDSIAGVDYPKEKLEAFIVDGMSTDGTREIVADYGRRFPYIRLVDNPGLTAPKALNVGIARARGEIIARWDAHNEYPAEFLKNAVALLKATGAANAGGRVWMVPNGDSPWALAVAHVTAHPFGVGNGRWHYGGRPGFVDTVPGGCYRRSALERVGPFDERLTRNQDNELNDRLRRYGYKIASDPQLLQIRYWNQGTLKGLLRQGFLTSMWNVYTLLLHPYTWKWRRFVPAAFVAYLILTPAGLAAGPAGAALALVPLTLYLSLVSAYAAAGGRKAGGPHRAAATFVLYHLSYGAGTFYGIVNVLTGRWRRHLGGTLKK
jgi:glycosyltransferase involved in cell wall biosynthesis